MLPVWEKVASECRPVHCCVELESGISGMKKNISEEKLRADQGEKMKERGD